MHLSLDTWLWIFAAVIPFAMGALGGHVSSDSLGLKITFWLFGILGAFVVVVGGIRNQTAQAALQKQLDAIQKNTATPPKITVNVPPGKFVLPPASQHTHMEYFSVGEASKSLGIQGIPIGAGATPTIPMAFRNVGGFAIQRPIDSGLLMLVPANSYKTAFRDFRREMVTFPGPGGTMPAGAPDGAYHTVAASQLSKGDAAKLASGELCLCGIGSVRWFDTTGEYETHFAQCLRVEPDHAFNWHTLEENNNEVKIK